MILSHARWNIKRKVRRDLEIMVCRLIGNVAEKQMAAFAFFLPVLYSYRTVVLQVFRTYLKSYRSRYP